MDTNWPTVTLTVLPEVQDVVEPVTEQETDELVRRVGVFPTATVATKVELLGATAAAKYSEPKVQPWGTTAAVFTAGVV